MKLFPILSLTLIFLFLSPALSSQDCGQLDSTSFHHPIQPGIFETHEWKVAPSGDKYVAGEVKKRATPRLAVMKIGADGEKEWQKYYNQLVLDKDHLIRMALDKAGNVYLFDSWKRDTADVYITKLSANGSRIFRKKLVEKIFVEDLRIKTLNDGSPVVAIWQKQKQNLLYPCRVNYLQLSTSGGITYSDTLGDYSQQNNHELYSLNVTENQSYLTTKSTELSQGINIYNYSKKQRNWAQRLEHPSIDTKPKGDVFVKGDSIYAIFAHINDIQFNILDVNGQIVTDSIYDDAFQGRYIKAGIYDNGLKYYTQQNIGAQQNPVIWQLSSAGRLDSLWTRRFTLPEEVNSNFVVSNQGTSYFSITDTLNVIHDVEKLYEVNYDGSQISELVIDTFDGFIDPSVGVELRIANNGLHIKTENKTTAGSAFKAPIFYDLTDTTIKRNVYKFEAVRTFEKVEGLYKFKENGHYLFTQTSRAPLQDHARILSLTGLNTNWEFIPSDSSKLLLPMAVYTDSAGNTYIAGRAYPNDDTYFSGNPRIVKVNQNGIEDWDIEIDSPSSYTFWISDISTDDLNNLYICGSFRKELTGEDFGLLVKLNEDGQLIFIRIKEASGHLTFRKFYSVTNDEIVVSGFRGNVAAFYHFEQNGSYINNIANNEATYYVASNKNFYLDKIGGYFQHSEKKLIRETKDGEVIWEQDLMHFNLPEFLDHTYNLEDSIIYILYQDARPSKVAIDAFTFNGEKLWDNQFPEIGDMDLISASIKFSDQGLYLATNHDNEFNLYLLDGNTGNENCRKTLRDDLIYFNDMKITLANDSTLLVFNERFTGYPTIRASRFIDLYQWVGNNLSTNLPIEPSNGEDVTHFTLFPNPAEDQLTISMLKDDTSMKEYTLRFVSINGAVEKEVLVPNFDKRLDLVISTDDLANNHYYLVNLIDAETGRTIGTRKLLTH